MSVNRVNTAASQKYLMRGNNAAFSVPHRKSLVAELKGNCFSLTERSVRCACRRCGSNSLPHASGCVAACWLSLQPSSPSCHRTAAHHPALVPLSLVPCETSRSYLAGGKKKKTSTFLGMLFFSQINFLT